MRLGEVMCVPAFGGRRCGVLGRFCLAGWAGGKHRRVAGRPCPPYDERRAAHRAHERRGVALLPVVVVALLLLERQREDAEELAHAGRVLGDAGAHVCRGALEEHRDVREVVDEEPAGVQPADLAQRSDVALVQALRVLILHEGNRALKGDRRHCAAADKTAARALRLRQPWADPELRARVADAVTATQSVTGFDLPSGATHDASAMSDLCPVAMMFVRCRGGVSHRPDEFVTDADMALAVDALDHLLAGL